MAGVITVEVDQIYNYVERQALKAITTATAEAVDRVKSHAPVRALFPGTTFRTGKLGFRQPIVRRVSADGEQRVGHANSSIPVFRTVHAAGSTFISGDFRRLDIASGRLAKIGTGFQQSTIGKGGPTAFGSEDRNETAGRKGSVEPEELAGFVAVKGGKVRKLNPQTLEARSANNRLTTRGRYEVASGRANFRQPTFDAKGNIIASGRTVHVGGRLKGEIHAEGPVIEDGIIWGYVVSATKDPNTGRLYPRDQEFGTVHNRPHPFMRPGLHESRGPLRRELRQAIRRGPQ